MPASGLLCWVYRLGDEIRVSPIVYEKSYLIGATQRDAVLPVTVDPHDLGSVGWVAGGGARRDERAVEADQTYPIRINGVRCMVLPDADELDGYGATMRPLQVVNDLLAQAGAAVRLFVAYPGGNEGLAVLVDPRVPAAMRASGRFDVRDLRCWPATTREHRRDRPLRCCLAGASRVARTPHESTGSHPVQPQREGLVAMAAR